MGVFDVKVKLRNWQQGLLFPGAEPDPWIACQAVVDSGAVTLALPTEVVEQLRLVPMGEVRARTADGTPRDCRLMGIVEIEVQGRSWRGQAVELPLGTQPLLGAVPLEEMDWHISPKDKKLLPNPDSPDKPQVWLLALPS